MRSRDLRQAHQREAALAALLVAATIGLDVTILLAMTGMLLLHFLIAAQSSRR